jgi:hypothetical protein
MLVFTTCKPFFGIASAKFYAAESISINTKRESCKFACRMTDFQAFLGDFRPKLIIIQKCKNRCGMWVCVCKAANTAMTRICDPRRLISHARHPANFTTIFSLITSFAVTRQPVANHSSCRPITQLCNYR